MRRTKAIVSKLLPVGSGARAARVTLLALMLSASCAPPERDSGAAVAAAEARPDWFKLQRTTHTAVDNGGDASEAIARLESLLNEAAPAHVPRAVAEASQKDTYFRLASLHMDARSFDEALKHADSGLALNRHPDAFTVNLMIVRALALRATGHSDVADAQLKVARNVAAALKTEVR